MICKKKCQIFFIPNIFCFKILLLVTLFSFILLHSFYREEKNYLSPNTYRIAFVFGTRPEAIKLFPLINELKKNKKFICISINTGQHKEMMKQILKSLNMDNLIDFNLKIMTKNQSLAKLTSNSISEIERIYNLINPNAVIVQGDTTTALAAAISAFYQKIPVFHVEAGLRTNNLNYPFPEEFNRVTIDDISTLHFAPTEWSASNLMKENKNLSNIFITGNTIVDTLKITLNNTYPSIEIKNLIEKASLLCLPHSHCKIILLTCHRRENYFNPIYNILKAVQELLKNFKDIVIIFPFHLNPNVRQSIKNSIPSEFYEDIIKRKKIESNDYSYLNRLLMIPPLNFIDLIHLESSCYFIMSDSGGIQEEAISIGKPILILRENTERPEGVKSGCAFLVGTSFKKIYSFASSLLINKGLYNKMSKPQYLYGRGNSSIIISQIIDDYFNNSLKNSILFEKLNYNDIISQYDNYISKTSDSNIKDSQNNLYDLVIILTVWKRNNLEKQLVLIKNQSILRDRKTNIIIFQNSNHTNVNDIVNKWKAPNTFSEKVDITFIKSPIETGYFGRFIIPLTSSVEMNSYFIICDDDVIWGNRFFENMLRVVKEGSLAVRTGRIIGKDYSESHHAYLAGRRNTHVCFDEDIEYDFGGQTWAGRISWLRKAWNHIPISLENSEDFWISAVLKSFYNISTKLPKCPCPKGEPIIPDMCAASDVSAFKHENANVGKLTITHLIRKKLMKEISLKFNYQLLTFTKPEYVKNLHKKFVYSNLNHSLFNLSNKIWKDALFWQ